MMSRRSQMGMAGKCQRGFSIVSAIFLLVVLTALGAAMLTFSTVQHTSSAQDMQGTRAYQAARAGIEWGAFKQLNPLAASCFASPVSFVPQAPTLSSFTVTVTCASFTSSGVTVYRIQSTACNQPAGGSCPGTPGGVFYIERRMEVTL